MRKGNSISVDRFKNKDKAPFNYLKGGFHQERKEEPNGRF